MFKDGTDEFTPPPGKPRNKQFRTQVRKFLTCNSRAVSEFPLQMFSTWFHDLPLSKLMKQNEREDCDEIWQYKVVILYPGNAATSKVDVRRSEWATEAAIQFYGTSFNSTQADLSCINRAVTSDPTIIIVGRPIGEGEDQIKTIVGRADSVVISCITFRSGSGDEAGSSLVLWLLVAESESPKPSFIKSWRRQGFGRLMLIMLIKMSTSSLLSHFELSHCATRLLGVDLYLQCPHKEPMAFYHACGFLQINLQDNTGIELLPKTIADTLLDENAGGFAWILPETEDHCIIPLMRLCSGSFLKSAVEAVQSKIQVINATTEGPSAHLNNSTEESVQSKNKIVSATYGGSPSLTNSGAVIVVDIESSNEIVRASNGGSSGNGFEWCRYPPSTYTVDNAAASVLLTNTDLEEAFVGLDFVSNLLPPPFCVLVSPHKMRGSGEMGSDERLKHSKSGGKTWMATGELQMMTALLMMDGRYEASAAIISFTDMQLIQGCFELLQRHLSAKKYEKDLMGAKEEELREVAEELFKDIDNEYAREVAKVDYVKKEEEKYTAECSALVKEKYGGSKEELYVKYDDQMNYVVKNVLFFYPGLLEKRVIVFPTNLRNDHWGATFVFNAGDIVANVDHASSGSCRTCFFRYCSKHPNGTTTIPNATGIIWFLNLAFSYQEEQKRNKSKSETPTQMKWNSPFGRTFFGEMKGTKKFPALRVLDKGVLPLQDDGHSCGVGLIAAIGIILRDIIGTDNGATRFKEIFRHDCMKIKMSTELKVAEHICCFPMGTFPRLFDKGEFGSKSYLHVLKAEWFRLFDRIAELQHVTVPKRLNADHMVERCYESRKFELQQFTWPKTPILSNVNNNSVTSEEDVGDSEPSGTTESDMTSSEEDVSDSKPSGTTEEPVIVVGDNQDKDDHKLAGNDASVKFPPAGKVWKGGRPLMYGIGAIHVPDECREGHVARSRYQTFVLKNDIEKFRKKWRKNGDNKKDRPIVPRNDEAMNKFVESRFLYWGWSSTKDHKNEVEKKREEMKRRIDRCKKKETKEELREQYTKEISFMKKERRKYKRAFELEWTFGEAAMVHGLKYNPREDTFAARLVYSVKTKGGNLEEQEEIIAVSKDWIKDADYAEGVIQHVINLGNTDEFVPVPSGESILIHTKKVHKLRYVHPHTQWVPDPHYKRTLRSNNDSPGKRMKQIQAPGYWEVIFHGETQPVRTDDEFVSQFKKGFLDEVKRLRCGFVDIPVGDFKESHLHEHPNLLVTEAPRVQFVQSEGEDLCVSKSLASALHAIGFVKVAESLNQYGESQLRGGTVDAVRKVGQYAEIQLPRWITRKVQKRPHMLDWQELLQERMKDTILLGVLNESDGNGSHAVTIHGGYVYDANEVVTIPLCKEALDYCCSTPTVKNAFVSFRKVTLFFYDGPDVNRKSQMTLSTECSKRQRDDSEQDEGPRTVRTRTVSV